MHFINVDRGWWELGKKIDQYEKLFSDSIAIIKTECRPTVICSIVRGRNNLLLSDLNLRLLHWIIFATLKILELLNRKKLKTIILELLTTFLIFAAKGERLFSKINCTLAPHSWALMEEITMESLLPLSAHCKIVYQSKQ